MANSKINTVNIGGVDFMIEAASGSSDAGFVDDTIEVALKKLIDSFSVDGTYTGRFKATNTPNKWFSYQIDIFDAVASGYIVNTIDPEESYTVRYRSQTDEQATISSIGKSIAEHDDSFFNMIGVIFAYGGATAPNDFLLCDGSAVSRTEYAKLFSVIGTTYGSGDGSTTFNLPDCREVALVGIGQSTRTMGAHDVFTLGEFKDDQMQTHTHSIIGNPAWVGSDGYQNNGGWKSTGGRNSGNNTGRSGDVTRGKRLGVNYIIKYQ